MIARYLKDKIKLILLFLVFSMIFLMVFYLYNLPVYSVLYAILLCSILAIIVMGYDFYTYYNRHKKLTMLKKSIDISIEELPYGKNIIEEDYNSLIEELFNCNKNLILKEDTSRTEMIDFYTLWVHQIKTPISAMSVLLQESEGEENKKLLQELFKIERYVEVVLQYLRLGSVTSDLKLERYSLDKIVKQAVKKYAPMFIHKKIKLEIGELDIKILTDEKWATFVIEQLISNALKYTEKGIIKIYIEDENNLIIEDTGIGISEEDLPRVFEKGFTGFNGRMDKKSTGLGLYLCRKILDKLSHEIKITSEEGKGTKIYLNLKSEEVFFE